MRDYQSKADQLRNWLLGLTGREKKKQLEISPKVNSFIKLEELTEACQCPFCCTVSVMLFCNRWHHLHCVRGENCLLNKKGSDFTKWEQNNYLTRNPSSSSPQIWTHSNQYIETTEVQSQVKRLCWILPCTQSLRSQRNVWTIHSSAMCDDWASFSEPTGQ